MREREYVCRKKKRKSNKKRQEMKGIERSCEQREEIACTIGLRPKRSRQLRPDIVRTTRVLRFARHCRTK
jgi:hypothetical protein